MAIVDNVVRILKNGTAVGTNKGSSSTIPSVEAYFTYGGSSDLWGTTWSQSDISTMGFYISYYATVSGVSSSYLTFNTHNLSVPSGATINGIYFEVKHKLTGSSPNFTVNVNFARVTVYYTALSGVISSACAVCLIGGV